MFKSFCCNSRSSTTVDTSIIACTCIHIHNYHVNLQVTHVWILHHILQCKGKEISWSHLTQLYNRDTSGGQGVRMIPKLKFEHISLDSFSKMRVDLAAQVSWPAILRTCMHHVFTLTSTCKFSRCAVSLCLKLSTSLEERRPPRPHILLAWQTNFLTVWMCTTTCMAFTHGSYFKCHTHQQQTADSRYYVHVWEPFHTHVYKI